MVGEVLEVMKQLARGGHDHGGGHPRDGLCPGGGQTGSSLWPMGKSWSRIPLRRFSAIPGRSGPRRSSPKCFEKTGNRSAVCCGRAVVFCLGGLPGRGLLWFFAHAVGTARNGALPGGREKWFVDGRRKRETERLFSAFSQRVPTHVPSPPSRWAGRYQRDKERAAGQVLRKKYGLPHTIPPEKGVQREEPLPSGVLSPISSQEMGPRLGKPPFPAVPTAQELSPTARETRSRREIPPRRLLPFLSLC